MLRRSFLSAALAAPAPGDEKLPSIRKLTQGPKFHWFGYYDKLQFDPTGRFVLGAQVDFEHRSPTPEDEIRVGIIDTAKGDTQKGDTWKEIGRTKAWNWQQGCMLQWMPGSKTDVVWNERDGDRFVSRIHNTRTGQSRIAGAAIYALSPDGRTAVAPDFRRLNVTRPGYGYAGIPDPNDGVVAPDNAGIWKQDLRSGKSDLIITFAQAAAFPNPMDDFKGVKHHWFNHLLYSPSGHRFIFLHRWRRPGQNGFNTRLFTADANGKDLYVTDPYGGTSHFIWRDDDHILAWAKHPSHGEKFYLYRDRTDKVEVVGKDVMTVNGHCTYLPGNKWILNDTYPDKQRLQHPYLYEVASGRRVPIGHFDSPKEYTGEWRCDLHPRFSPDGRQVVIDSTHGRDGRQMYLIDITGLTA
jgi:hypothetical protein